MPPAVPTPPHIDPLIGGPDSRAFGTSLLHLPLCCFFPCLPLGGCREFLKRFFCRQLLLARLVVAVFVFEIAGAAADQLAFPEAVRVKEGAILHSWNRALLAWR